jgi:STE24 endopeptidase
MPEQNGFFFLIFAIVVGCYILDLVANLLNLSRLGAKLPAGFEDTYDADDYAHSQAYTREGSRFELFSDSCRLVIFLSFWLCGGFAWLVGWAEAFEFGPVITGLLVFSALYLAQSLLAVPFELYDTFVIEEKYGFNKTTARTWLADHAKGLVLTGLLGLPLLALLLWLFGRFENAWFFAWLAVAVFSLAMLYLAPRYIMPLFNKFEPLEDEELKQSINAMAERCEFPLTEISVMDGSKRSSKSNAFFTGFGKNKKIALFDTLVEKQTRDELVAVLAHEIGHYKLKHIVKMVAFSFVQTAVMFFLLGLFLESAGLSKAFGLAEPRVYASFLFFGILFTPLSKILSILSHLLSRKHEFEADAYAAEKTGAAGCLVSALKKLSKDNLSNLTPHPFYAFLYHSHPPVLQRIEALRSKG